MADLVITPSLVGIAGSSQVIPVIAGEAIVRGQPVFLDAVDNKYRLAKADDMARANAVGIAQSEGGLNEWILIQRTGAIKFDAVLSVGQSYYVSRNSGRIAPYADLVAGDYVTSVIRASKTSEAFIDFDNTQILIT